MKYWFDHPVLSAFSAAGLALVVLLVTSIDPLAEISEPAQRQPVYLGAGGLLAAAFAGCITAAALVFSLSDRGRSAVAVRYHGASLVRVLFIDLGLILSAATVVTLCAAFDAAESPSGVRHVAVFAIVAGLVGIAHLGHLLAQLLAMELADRHRPR